MLEHDPTALPTRAGSTTRTSEASVSREVSRAWPELLAALSAPPAERLERAACALQTGLAAALVAVVTVAPRARRVEACAIWPACTALAPEEWLDGWFLDGRPVSIGEVTSRDAPVLRFSSLWPGPGALEVSPLLTDGGGVVGCIVVARATPLDGEERAMLEGFCTPLAALVEVTRRTEAAAGRTAAGEERLRAHLHLLAAIREVQSDYIGDGVPSVPFRRFLRHLLELSGAHNGFVCEVVRSVRDGGALHWVVRVGGDEIEHAGTPRAGLRASAAAAAEEQDCSRLEALVARFEREPIVQADFDELPLELSGKTARLARELGPYLVVPLREHARLVGIAGFAASELAPGVAPLALEDHLRPFLDSFANILVAFRTSQAHAAAEAEAARLAYLLDQASNEILVFDGHTLCFVQANDRARRNLGYDASALAQITPLSLLPQIGANHFQSMLEILRRRDQEHVSFETVVRRRDNTFYPVDVALQIATDEDDSSTFFVAIMQDISARKQAEARASYLVHHDRLTGLPNRLGFIDRLEQVLARARQEQRSVAVLFLDLDRFQIINDTLGHDAGDQLLKLVTQRLIPNLRPGDTLARLGGDEFTLILPGIELADEAALLSQRLLEAFGDPFELGERELFTSASIGITLFPADATDIGGLLKSADTALGHAKRSGRNRYAFFTAEMNARAIERLALENELRRALERNELVVHYQPQIDLRTGRITGVEALLRWQHPRLGLVSPSSFVPLAEETGLIVALGEWVLRTACHQARAWHARGHAGLRVAINLSARQMVQTILPSLHTALLETGIDPHCVELELTESLLMEDNPASLQALRELQALGISFSIDDFGTGYSNLGYLKQLPIDTLKIDRSFVRDVMRDPDDAAIARAIIAMAHGLGIRVIAEGVETRAQLDFLIANQCDAFQGFLFSAALPAELLGRLLDERRGLDDIR